MKTSSMTLERVAPIVAEFEIGGRPTSVTPHGSGHINDTYAVTVDSGSAAIRYVFQRINSEIFRDVESLMQNISRVTAHLRSRLEEMPGRDAERGTLVLIRTRKGDSFLHTSAGDFWRAYRFIDGASTHDVCRGPDQAREAARAFGEFQEMLVDIPGSRLAETIPFFHHTPRRFEALEKAIAADTAGRRSQVGDEIAFCMSRKGIIGRIIELLAGGRIPERITHNDTKLNNVMIDDRTGRALCVIDLDTVMPGSVLYDFGDMVRTFTPTALEDEPDLSKVSLNIDIFRALAGGYIETAGGFLVPAEFENLVFSGKLITFTIGIRFLTDYLSGDVYFKIKRPGHNLDRARTQFKMVGEIEKHEPEMEQIVREARG